MTVPNGIKLPGTYLSISNVRAVTGLTAPVFTTCFFGQKIAAGTATAETYVQVFSPEDAATKFGPGSQLHEMFVYYFKNNQLNEVFAVALEDAGGSAAGVQKLVTTGTATAAGTVFLYVNGKQVQVPIASGDTPTLVSTAMVAAITADADLPVTAAVNTADADLTAKQKGTVGNRIDIRFNYNEVEAFPAGITGIVASVDTAGATDPDMDDALQAVPDDVISSFVSPFQDATNIGKLKVEIQRRFGPTIQLEGHAVTMFSGTSSAVGTVTSAFNDPFLSPMHAGLSRPMPDYVQTGALAGVMAASLGDDPGRPLQTLELVGILPEVKTNQLLDNERTSLINDGCGTTKITRGGAVIIERMVTSYLTNASGSPDPSYQNTTTLFTSSYLRQTLIARVSQKYPRHKLGNDKVRYGSQQPVATPKMIEGTILGWFLILEELALVENYDQFKRELFVKRDINMGGSDPDRVNSVLPTDYINQFRIFAGQIQFIL